MMKITKFRLPLVSCLVLVFIGLFFSNISQVEVLADTALEIQEKLATISHEEKEILQNLFTMTQEIEAMDREEAEITEEIDSIHLEVQGLERIIEEEEKAFNHKRDILKQVLKSYQRRGPGSYLEIVLSSDSLSNFLRRINTLRDMTRNTGELMEEINLTKKKLATERSNLEMKLKTIEEQQQLLRISRENKLALIKEQEDYLSSLREEKAYYQKHLNNIEKVWNEIKPLFKETTKELTRIVAEGNLPVEALKTSITLRGIKASLDEKTFNDILAGRARLHGMEFTFSSGKVEIAIPDKELALVGTFVIEGGSTLRFEPKEGSFYGMPLKESSITDLFKGNDLVLNLDPLLGGFKVNAVDVFKGYIELSIGLN